MTTLITTHSFGTNATSLIQAANDDGILLQKKGGTDWFVALPADFGVDSSSKRNNCGVCDEPDDHHGMLKCAKCLMWFHCVCVGIPIDVAQKMFADEFRCPLCRTDDKESEYEDESDSSVINVKGKRKKKWYDANPKKKKKTK